MPWWPGPRKWAGRRPSARCPAGREVSQALRPTYRHRTDGFMEVKQALRHIEAAANAWEAAAEHQQAALCARELLLPQAGPDLLDQLLWQSQTVARRLRAQEKTLEALLLLRQFPYAGAAGKCRIHDEAAARLREACSLRMNELPAELPAAVADIDAALHRELADISPRMAGLLDAIGPDGKLPGVPSRMPPPGSDARQAEAIEEAWLATYAHSCAALEDAARALLARSHPSEISSPAAAVKAGALTHPEAREGRATLRRNAALHKTMAPLLAGLQPPPDGAATRRKAGQGAPPQAPWLHALEAFGEWNLVLQRVENARRTLQAHSASWSPAQREASRDAIDSVQARLAAAQANASEQGREALVQSLAHLARQGIHASQEMPGSDPSAARHALAGAAEAARHAREALERSGLHARMAPVCTAIAQACEAMAHVPRTAAEARDHAARLQAAERQARAAAWEELAPDMHRLADLCGTACEGRAARRRGDGSAGGRPGPRPAGRRIAGRNGGSAGAATPACRRCGRRAEPAADAMATAWRRRRRTAPGTAGSATGAVHARGAPRRMDRGAAPGIRRGRRRAARTSRHRACRRAGKRHFGTAAILQGDLAGRSPAAVRRYRGTVIAPPAPDRWPARRWPQPGNSTGRSMASMGKSCRSVHASPLSPGHSPPVHDQRRPAHAAGHLRASHGTCRRSGHSGPAGP